MSSETIFDLATRQQELNHLEEKAADPDLWQNSEAGQATLQKLAQVRDSVAPILALEKRLTDVADLADMAAEDTEEDPSLEAELSAEVESIQQDLARYELETLLSGEHDSGNAII